MRRPPLARTLLCSTIVIGVLAACAPAAPTSPPPSPSVYHCIADGVRTPGTCSRADYEAQQKEQQLFTEAQRVYRAFTDERVRLVHEGGADEATPAMRETATGKFLVEMVVLLRSQKSLGEKVFGPYKLSNMRIERSQTRPDAELVMRACEDGREMTAIGPQGNELPNCRIVNMILFFKTEDGRFKIYYGEGKAAKECLPM